LDDGVGTGTGTAQHITQAAGRRMHAAAATELPVGARRAGQLPQLGGAHVPQPELRCRLRQRIDRTELG
tara:strand:+ start:163 stop:369 length:207 start_codon:yes stop_codon:yes gene_type:complete